MGEIQNRPAVYDRFLQFRAMVIQAIALAWKDKTFAKKFKSNPREAFFEAFGYDCPFDIDIVSEENNAKWGGYYSGEWETVQQEQITMVLPPKPEQADEEPIALLNWYANHLTFMNGN